MSFGVILDKCTLGVHGPADGLCPPVGAPSPPRAGPSRLGGVQKSLPATVSSIRASLPPGTPIELWWQDEARVGQKNPLHADGHAVAAANRHPRISTRPTPTSTAYAYIFGAICPENGKGAGLVLPRCDSEAMSLHLAKISRSVDPGAHAVLMLDGVGWHSAHDVIVPANLSPPPYAPELNRVENVWQFLHNNWLGDRIFSSYDDIVDRCCEIWNRLIDQPWKILSPGLPDRAYRS